MPFSGQRYVQNVMVDFQVSDFHECRRQPAHLRADQREIQGRFQRNFAVQVDVPAAKDQDHQSCRDQKEDHQRDGN